MVFRVLILLLVSPTHALLCSSTVGALTRSQQYWHSRRVLHAIMINHILWTMLSEFPSRLRVCLVAGIKKKPKGNKPIEEIFRCTWDPLPQGKNVAIQLLPFGSKGKGRTPRRKKGEPRNTIRRSRIHEFSHIIYFYFKNLE
jgi:hypothetical protein